MPLSRYGAATNLRRSRRKPIAYRDGSVEWSVRPFTASGGRAVSTHGCETVASGTRSFGFDQNDSCLFVASEVSVDSLELFEPMDFRLYRQLDIRDARAC